jgi:hypothetical protein
VGRSNGESRHANRRWSADLSVLRTQRLESQRLKKKRWQSFAGNLCSDKPSSAKAGHSPEAVSVHNDIRLTRANSSRSSSAASVLYSSSFLAKNNIGVTQHTAQKLNHADHQGQRIDKRTPDFHAYPTDRRNPDIDREFSIDGNCQLK